MMLFIVQPSVCTRSWNVQPRGWFRADDDDRTADWCGRRDSNPQVLRRGILSPLWLPVSPRPHCARPPKPVVGLLTARLPDFREHAPHIRSRLCEHLRIAASYHDVGVVARLVLEGV